MNTYRVYLKAQSAATSAGPNFNIVPNVGVANPSQITKTQLLSGILITVDISATSLSLVSTGGTCSSSFNVAIQKDPNNCVPVGDPVYPTATPTPTATPSVTTTPTATPSVTTTPTATPSVTTTPTATPSVTTTPTATPSVTTTPTATPSVTSTPGPLIDDPDPTPCPPPPPPPSPSPRPPITGGTGGGGCCDPFFTIAKLDPLPVAAPNSPGMLSLSPPANDPGWDGTLSNEERFIALWEDNGPNALKEMATLIYQNIDGTDLWIFHKNKLVPSIGGCVIQYVRVWMNGVEHLYVAGSLPNANTVVQYGPFILNMFQSSSEQAGNFLELGISWESIPGGLKTLSGGFGLVMKRAALNSNYHWRSSIGVTVDGFTEAGKPWGITRRHLEALTKLRPSSLTLPEDPFPMPSPAFHDGEAHDEAGTNPEDLSDSELADLLETGPNLTQTCEETFNRVINTGLPAVTTRPPRPDDPMDDPNNNYIVGVNRGRFTGSPLAPLKDRVQLYVDPLRLSGS
jgi:hypothetical protein